MQRLVSFLPLPSSPIHFLMSISATYAGDIIFCFSLVAADLQVGFCHQHPQLPIPETAVGSKGKCKAAQGQTEGGLWSSSPGEVWNLAHSALGHDWYYCSTSNK